ncbi:hypothetical protein A2U01_0016712 [Trifolium medium]|uniref:FAS1 domain-containing protein n=1 Tax=Trifolium medium TaxID=97028 RepID=A0A392N7K4_9FABA|nr:hypothetical protein [Trifolium medium]
MEAYENTTGITLFMPEDMAFANLPAPIRNLTVYKEINGKVRDAVISLVMHYLEMTRSG